MSQAVFYVEGRHRLAVEPLVLVLGGDRPDADRGAHVPSAPRDTAVASARDNLT